MKKILVKVVIAVAAVIMFASCGVSSHITANANLNQTNVVLSQKNFHIVKTVEAEVSATYIFGIGGFSQKALKDNAVAKLTENAGLTGSQALVNITFKSSNKMILFYNKVTCYAEATVIEFDK